VVGHVYPDPQTSVPASPHVDTEELTRLGVLKILEFHRGIDNHLGTGLFEAPCLMILLELLLAEFEKRRLSIKHAVINSGVPQSTALRWIDRMVAQGLITRHANPADRRSAHLGLTADARRILSAFVRQVRD